MKKTIASVLYVTCLAFGIAVHAAEPNIAPASEPVATRNDLSKSEKKAQRAADRALSKKVVWALSKTKGLNAINVTVLAHRGTVSMTGFVPDSQQVRLAGDSAGRVAGVTSVVNNLVPGEPGG